MRSEAEVRADFASLLRYAQCWEDADILVDALDVKPDHTCVSIASAGENSFSLLSRGPKKVIAIDLNPAQLAAVELRRSRRSVRDRDQRQDAAHERVQRG